VTGDRYSGAEIGRSYELPDLGVWGAAITKATTLRQAIAVAVKGIHLLHQGTNLQLTASDRFIKLQFAFAGHSHVDPRQHVLGSLTVLRTVALLPGVPEAVGAQFSQAYQPDAGRLEETFGPQLSFGCDGDAILVDRAILDLPIATNAAKNGIDPLETAATLETLVRTLLPYEKVTADFVASLLHMSTRTLQRRLADWGFSFEEIVDDVRRTEAIRRILIGDGSLVEIAFLLGYSDQAHFYRAFRRWTGMTPSEYRAQFAAVRHRV